MKHRRICGLLASLFALRTAMAITAMRQSTGAQPTHDRFVITPPRLSLNWEPVQAAPSTHRNHRAHVAHPTHLKCATIPLSIAILRSWNGRVVTAHPRAPSAPLV